MNDRATSAKLARRAGLGSVLDAVGDWGAGAGAGPLFRRLARAIAGAVERGAVARGSRLPSERSLAAALAVSRGTVVAAYDLLVADGIIERREGSGTAVLEGGALGLPPGREGSALVHRLVDRSDRAGGAGTSTRPPELIDLSISVLHDAAGLPAVSVSTRDLERVTPDTGYSPWGLPGLRRAVARHVTGWGLPTDEGEIVITTGAQQAITAAAACWVRPGDAVLVEDPTYPGAVAAFTQAGARLIGVATDDQGVVPGALRRALDRHPSLVYLQPTLHSPLGVSLAEHRRREIAGLITASRVPLVEDLALADLAWRRPQPPPVAAGCPGASVAVVGSMSKLFWGGLRVGFVRAPESLALRFARVKATHDLGSSVPGQLLAERLLERADDFGDRRREGLRANYEALAGALGRHLPDWTWREPDGGLSVWVRLPGDRAEALAQAALREGVAVATARPLTASGGHADRIRLSFAASPAILDEGVRRLARAWARS